MNTQYKKAKAATYLTSVSMAVAAAISPLLFLTFRELYDISYTLLGLLVLANFVTQLTVDLIFSFFSHRFNIHLSVKMTPFIMTAGFLIFASAPIIFPNNTYIGLILGTVIFSSACGLAEVLLSPVIASIPAENPESEMSKLHSCFAWGSVGVVIVISAFLRVFDNKNWQILVILLALVPISAATIFATAKLPPIDSGHEETKGESVLKSPIFYLFVFGLFLGGSAECVMSGWASSYLESALGLPKIVGDIFGVALFGALGGVGRILYSKHGKNIEKTLLISAIGTTLCYIIAAISPIPAICVLACALTGLGIAMMWPGTLIAASKKFAAGGVVMYAFLAAGGDLGAALGPQLVGVIVDAVPTVDYLASLASSLGMTPDALGMRIGILFGALFPLILIGVYAYIIKGQKKEEKQNSEIQ